MMKIRVPDERGGRTACRIGSRLGLQVATEVGADGNHNGHPGENIVG